MNSVRVLGYCSLNTNFLKGRKMESAAAIAVEDVVTGNDIDEEIQRVLREHGIHADVDVEFFDGKVVVSGIAYAPWHLVIFVLEEVVTPLGLNLDTRRLTADPKTCGCF